MIKIFLNNYRTVGIFNFIFKLSMCFSIRLAVGLQITGNLG